MTFYDTGDTGDFQSKVKEQLAQDLAESQEEYNAAILAEVDAKADLKRHKYLKLHPKEVKSKADRNIMKKDLSVYEADLPWVSWLTYDIYLMQQQSSRYTKYKTR